MTAGMISVSTLDDMLLCYDNMDQDAFRLLLSAPRASGSGSTPTSKSVLGGGKPKQGWGLRPKPGKKYDTPRSDDKKDAAVPEVSGDDGGSGESSRPEMAPRMYHKQLLKEKGYKDRAEMRRLGENDEYQGVQKLLDDFERRKKAAEDAGEDIEQIEKQRAYLGGDAEHSVLVKGLDFALLAARKAELAREGEEVADEELDALADSLRGKNGTARGNDAAGKLPEETMAKGFRSIAQKKADEEAAKKGEKKKKKKKKVKTEGATADAAKSEAKAAKPEPSAEIVGQAAVVQPGPAKVSEMDEAKPGPSSAAQPAEQDIDDDDIFADAGEYELGGGKDDEEDDEDDGADMAGPSGAAAADRRRAEDEPNRARARSRSRSGDRRRNDREHGSRGRERYRSPSRSRSRSVDSYRDREHYRRRRSYSRGGQDDYDRRDRHSPRWGDAHDCRRDERYDSDRRYDDRRRYSRDRSRSRDRYDRRNRYDHQYSPEPRRYRGSSRDYDRRRDPSYSRSRSPYSPPPPKRARRSVSRSQSPAPRAVRARTRSITPPLFAGYTAPSPAWSELLSEDEDEDEPAPGGKLAPLQSSAIGDLRSFLAKADEDAKADEQRLRKARWRAQQGLPPQESAEELHELEKRVEARREAEDDKRAAAGPASGGNAPGEGRGGKRRRGDGKGAGGPGGPPLSKEAKDSRAEKRKANREYILLMNQMKKDDAGAA